MSKSPVILYGASGYTGRLVAEYLREYQLPFIAAGRDAARCKEAMSLVPGIETAEYEVVQVEHTLDALVELFSGAKVVCNTVGPFARFGTLVVQAALKAGCHYLDTTGEQEWMLAMRDEFGAAYAEKGLVLAPSTAYMHAVGNIAAELCLEQPGIDSLDAVCVPTGVPTVGSTRTVMDMCRNKQHWLENGQLVEIENPMAGCEVAVPGMISTVLGLPWGGGSLPLWYAEDHRVRNCQSRTGFTNRPLMQGVVDLAAHYEANLKHLPNDEQEAALNAVADNVTPGMPPRENRNIHRTVDMCYGTGNNTQVKCTIVSNGGYLMTGLVQGFIANQLIKGGGKAVGFQAPTNIVGHHELLAALQSYGFCNVNVETI
ncbi:saccharopine dehydrogenase family protein [Amphritea sp. HPY]|uniref:saccharopine dehydrogenase family protein n=1 Tax=Amphritea sp. HPY TaxID=3421652 RepID=UPI003D7C61E1